MIKNLHANAGNTGDSGLIPGLGRSPGGGNGPPFRNPEVSMRDEKAISGKETARPWPRE